jgi:hypothetical protein
VLSEIVKLTLRFTKDVLRIPSQGPNVLLTINRRGGVGRHESQQEGQEEKRLGEVEGEEGGGFAGKTQRRSKV